MASDKAKKGKDKLKETKNFTHRFEEKAYLRFKRLCALKGYSTAVILQELLMKWADKSEKEIRTAGIDEILHVQNG